MDEYLAIIKMFAGNFAPRGFMYCQGQQLAISTNTALFSLLGTTYGGNGQTTFGLPDLRGRVPVGTGQGPGLSLYTLGEMDGTENTTLNQLQMPIHTHQAVFTPGGSGGGGSITSSLMASNKQATESVPGTNSANTLAAPNDTANLVPIAGYVNDAAPTVPLVGLTVTGSASGGGTVTVATAGGSQPFSIQQPYLAMNYIICTEGVFPPRN